MGASDRLSRKMLKRPFSPAAAVCAILIGCVVVLWLRSYREGDLIGWEKIAISDDGPGATIDGSGVFSARGSIGIGGFRQEISEPKQVQIARQKKNAAVRQGMAMDGSFSYHVIEEPNELFRYGDSTDPRGWLGFVCRWGKAVRPGNTIETDHGIAIPYWFAALLLGIVPLRWLVRGGRSGKETPSVMETKGDRSSRVV